MPAGPAGFAAVLFSGLALSGPVLSGLVLSGLVLSGLMRSRVVAWDLSIGVVAGYTRPPRAYSATWRK
ncbi:MULTISPECIES: hypothetical protein [unclassified Cupriavidus]|uniref:hypothetical protein n=1 Tax=unclassified Cupriavidus TaxID=2640874 RepID=UPI00313CC3E0